MKRDHNIDSKSCYMVLSDETYVYITILIIVCSCLSVLILLCFRFREQIYACCCASNKVRPESDVDPFSQSIH